MRGKQAKKTPKTAQTTSAGRSAFGSAFGPGRLCKKQFDEHIRLIRSQWSCWGRLRKGLSVLWLRLWLRLTSR